MKRKISITLAVLLGFAIGLPALALGLLHTGPGARFVETQAVAQTNGAIVLEGLAIHGFLDVRLTRFAMKGIEVTGLDLDWSPSALLSRTAMVESLRIESLTFTQTEDAQVDMAEAEAATPFALPQLPALPVALDIRTVDVEAFVFAAPNLGLEGRYTLRGSAQARRDLADVVAKLNADRIGGQGALVADISYGAARGGIKIDFDFADEDGAPLAAFTGFDGGALALSAHAEGPITGTQLVVDFALAKGPKAQAQFKLGYDAALKLQGGLQVQPMGVGGPDVAAYLGDALTVEVEATLAPDGAVAGFVRSALDAPKLKTNLVARAQGQLGGVLSLNVDSTQTSLADLPPALGPLDLQVRSKLDQATNVLAIDLLQVKAAAADISFKGDVPLATPYAAQLDGTIVIADLAALAPDLKGDLKADISLRGTAPDAPLALRLAAKANAASGAMSLTTIEAKVTGTATKDGTLDIETAFSVPSLTPLDPRLQGALNIAGNVKGSVGGMVADAAIRTTGFAFEGAPITALEADIGLAQKGEGAAGNVALRILTSGAPVMLATAFNYDGAIATLNTLSLAGPGLRGAGNIAYDLAEATGQGKVDVTVADLSQIAALAGMAANGQGQIALKLNGEDVALNATLTALGGADLGAIIETASAGITTHLADPMGALRGQVRAQNVVAGGASITDVTLDLGAGKAGPSFALSLSANAPVDLEMQAKGSAAIDDKTMFTLNILQGMLDGERFALAAPTQLLISPDGLGLDKTTLKVGAGQITAAFVQHRHLVEGEISLTALDLSNQMPNGFPLTLNGGASIKGAAHNPTVQLDMRATAPVEALDEELRITAKGGLTDGTLNAKLTLAGAGSDFESSLAGRVTLNMLEGIYSVAENVPLVVKAKGGVQLSPFTFLLFDDGSTLDGAVQLKANAVLAGGPERMAGSLCLENFAAGLVAAGTSLSGGAGCFTLANDGAITGKISADDGHGGKLDIALNAGAGTLLLSGPANAAAPMVNGRVQLSHLRVIDGDLGLVKVNGVIEGKAALDAALSGALSGALTVEQGDLIIPANPGPSFTALDVRHVGRPQDAVERDTAVVADGPQFGAGLDMDIKVNVPGQFFVRGRGIESEWRGDIAVGGTIAMPVIGGKISMIKGQATTGAAVLSFNRGVVTLVPDPPALVPIVLIDMVSEANVEGTTARMTLAGPVTEPKISFSSDPTLPEDEILARLLFGKPAAQMTASEALSMAGAALELAGTFGSGPGVLGRVRRGLGVDRLSVDASTDAPNSSSVSAGKYLTPDLYMSVKQAADGTAPDIAVEYEVTDEITVTGEQEGTGGESVGVRYEYDY